MPAVISIINLKHKMNVIIQMSSLLLFGGITMTQTLTMKQMERKLQRADRKHAHLYLFCNFIALMIISAYAGMMFSPTVQTVFPQGGDSRKQMNAIFILTLAGCVIFTIYAASLFFRHKSRQLGILMALGASRKRLVPGLFREVISLSGLSSIAGILAGFPFIWIIWTLFRLILIDSSDMLLSFDLRCLLVSLAFLLVVVAFSCMTAWHYLRKTNIMEIIREEHINEPVKELGKWCAPAGCILLLSGALLGYCCPILYMGAFNALPPAWMNLLYAPAFAGLYMIMLHAVVHGFRSYKHNPYKNIIARSMMKFQGRQTVNNMIVVALLIAGACFGIFYIPVMTVGAMMDYAAQPYDYFYHYRADQAIPDKETVESLAGEYGLSLKNWGEFEYLSLGFGGLTDIMAEDGKHWSTEYVPVSGESRVISENTWNTLTGENIDVLPGTYMCITNTEETSLSISSSARHITNMVTHRQLDTEYAGLLHYNLLTDFKGCRVLDQADYDQLAEGLTEDWMGCCVHFNIDGKDSYPFAKAFFRLLVSSYDDNCFLSSWYDRVRSIRLKEQGLEDWQESEPDLRLNPDEMDSVSFRLNWEYQPSFRILSQNDFLLSTSVFLMMFLFIFIVCILTALVICHTRCQTIALNNRYIFDDLKKLGASPTFLSKEVCSQCNSVFKIPTLVGMIVIFLLFILLLYANDSQLVFTEIVSLGVCLGIQIALGAVVYVVYRVTVGNIKKKLGICL